MPPECDTKKSGFNKYNVYIQALCVRAQIDLNYFN